MKRREQYKIDYDCYLRNVRTLKEKASSNARKLGEVRAGAGAHVACGTRAHRHLLLPRCRKNASSPRQRSCWPTRRRSASGALTRWRTAVPPWSSTSSAPSPPASRRSSRRPLACCPGSATFPTWSLRRSASAPTSTCLSSAAPVLVPVPVLPRLHPRRWYVCAGVGGVPSLVAHVGRRCSAAWLSGCHTPRCTRRWRQGPCQSVVRLRPTERRRAGVARRRHHRGAQQAGGRLVGGQHPRQARCLPRQLRRGGRLALLSVLLALCLCAWRCATFGARGSAACCYRVLGPTTNIASSPGPCL